MVLTAYRLVANGIGGRTVAELAETMEYDEFITWIAYGMIEPFGEERADWRAAAMMAQQANMNRPKGKPAQPVKNFLLRFETKASRERTMKEMEMALYAKYLAMGGKPADG